METEGVGALSATSGPNWRANGVGESAWGDGDPVGGDNELKERGWVEQHARYVDWRAHHPRAGSWNAIARPTEA